jgi:PASTA domain
MPRTVGVVVEPGQLQIEPGATGRLSVRVVNRSQVVDQFVVVVLGLDERITPEPQRLGLFPEQEGTAAFDIAVPAEKAPPAGPRVIAVRVTSQDDPRLSRVEEVTLTIGAAPAASLKVQPTRIRGGFSGRFAVQVSNDGNVPVQVALRGEDDADEVRFEFSPPLVEVAPGSVSQTSGRVRAKRPFSGPETQHPIVIHGEGGPVPLATRATFAQRSLIGSRVLQAVLALVALVAVLAVFLATRPHNGPTSNAVDQLPDASVTPSATATTPSATPTPSGTTGTGDGPVPDVSGSAAGDAASQLAKGGFTTEQVSAHSNTVAAGQVISTDPTPGKQTGADHKVTLTVSDGPTPAVDLRAAAKDADWSNGTVGLVVNGTDNDPRGFVLQRENVAIEDGTIAQRALETFPQQVPNGFIVGEYKLPNKIIPGDHFVTKTSFVQGSGGQVDFSILVVDAQGNATLVKKINQRDNNDVGKWDVDLSQFAGADTIQLRIDAGTSATGDAALWIDPRITGTPNAPVS